MRRLLLAGACLFGANILWATTLTGKIQNAGFAAIAEASLTLTLSQAAVLPGSFLAVPARVDCATAVDGSVVGVADPSQPPAVATSSAGALPAGEYVVALAWNDAAGATLLSPQTLVSLASAGELWVTVPALPPGATEAGIYIGTAPGNATLQAYSSAGVYVQSAPLIAGAAAPAQNGTVCALTGNDQLIPSDTYYTAELTDASGNPVPGFPQLWQLSGSPVDVSRLTPLAAPPEVAFPWPVLQNPSGIASQSVHSPLDLNGFPLHHVANLGPGYWVATAAGALPGPGSTLWAFTPNQGVTLERASASAGAAGGGGSLGVTLTVTDGANTCSFGGLLPGAATYSSTSAAGSCSFNGGTALTIAVGADDHATRPANVTVTLEMTGS